MEFDQLLDEASALLQRRGRLTYGALRRQFGLDETLLADLRDELVLGQRVAVDEGGVVLVWCGPGGPADRPQGAAQAPAPVSPPAGAVPAQAGPAAPRAASESSDGSGGSAPPMPAPRPGSPPMPSASALPSTPAGDTSAATSSGPVDIGRDAAAERRQITVMFCDFVGSTALAARLDPEDFGDILAVFHATCSEIITRFGGHVRQRLGDGVMAYFGYPRAREDAARSALKAALAMVPALREAAQGMRALGGEPLHTRIGIHSGLVVIGDIAADRLALGDTPNIAARLQGLAPTDGVLLSNATRKLAGPGFELKPLGAVEVKGLDEPMELWHALRELDAEDRLDDLGDGGEVQLVGREPELRLLQERWAKVREGLGEVVMVSGDPGIGKSLLLRAVRRHVVHQGGQCLVFRGSPYHTSSALHPLAERIRRAATLSGVADPAEARERLASWMRQQGQDDPEALTLFQALLGLAGGGDHLATLSQMQRRRLHELIVQWFMSLAARQPLLLVWEDLHWADPSTLELLDHLTYDAGGTPMMVVMSFRPEFQPPWRLGGNRSHLAIDRFTTQDVEQLTLRLTAGKRLPAEVMRLIVTQTDGVPLYVEEVTKLLLESGALIEREDRYELSGPLSTLSIPATLRDSLMARLDRKSPGREVAQLGAAVGREFSHQLIELLWTPAPGLLDEGLNQLVESELLLRRYVGRQASYVFKHAMFQEVAYESLLRRTREDYHARIVQVLEQRFPDLKNTQPEVLAHHYTGAGQLEAAVVHWRAAAERSIDTSAHAEAIVQVGKAIELQRQLPDSVEGHRSEITLQVRLGVSLTALRGYGAAEVERAYSRARELCYRIDAEDLMLPAVYGLWRYRLMRAEYAQARDLGQEMLLLARRYGQTEFQTLGHRALGSTDFYCGRLDDCIASMSLVLEAHAEPERRAQVLRYDVVDAWVTACAYRAWAHWLTGRPEAAGRDMSEALETAQRMGHPFSNALSLSFAGWLHQFQRDIAGLRDSATRALSVSSALGFEFWMGWNEALLGWAEAMDGDARRGATQIARGIQRWHATGSVLGRSYFQTLLAEAQMRAGDLSAAGQALEEALAFCESSGEGFWSPELHRVRAEWLERTGAPAAEVAAALDAGRRIAIGQNSTLLLRRIDQRHRLEGRP